MRFLIIFIISFVTLSQPGFAQEEYSFDLDEIEKKAYSFGGYVETRPGFFGFDKDAALYKLKLFNKDEGQTAQEYNTTVQLDGRYEKGIAEFHTKINADMQQSYLGWDDAVSIFEGYLSLKPSSTFSVNVGKKALKWGKGYAWNPVAFMDRAKNPDDPELALEGYVVLSADYIKSYSGPLKTVSFTPVLIPVSNDINSELGASDELNFAGKLYFLLDDTDIDFIVMPAGSKSKRYGFDFSRNITPNFEMHGEFAFIHDYEKKFINSNGDMFTDKFNAKNFLFGIRYLNQIDTTFIIEYYRNGTGFTEAQMQDYFSFINAGYSQFTTSGNDSLLQKALTLTEGNYGRANPMRDYLYTRISQKEPLEMLYYAAAITGIFNINDESFSLSPEIVYAGITNWELRLKTSIILGQINSEYGEKQNDYRIEFRGRYYF